jgi:hypothetical protein
MKKAKERLDTICSDVVNIIGNVVMLLDCIGSISIDN